MVTIGAPLDQDICAILRVPWESPWGSNQSAPSVPGVGSDHSLLSQQTNWGAAQFTTPRWPNIGVS